MNSSYVFQRSSIIPTNPYTNQRNLILDSLKDNRPPPQPYLGDYSQQQETRQNPTQQQNQFLSLNQDDIYTTQNQIRYQAQARRNSYERTSYIQEEQKDFRRDRPSSLQNQLHHIPEQEEWDAPMDGSFIAQPQRGSLKKGKILQKLKYEILDFEKQQQSQLSQNELFQKPSTMKQDLKTIGSYTPSRIVSQSATFRESKSEYYSTKQGNDELRILQKQYLQTETLIQKEFGINFTDLEKHSRSWIIKKLLPNFLKALEQTLKNINLILTQYFYKQVSELDLFSNILPIDRGSPLAQVSIDQILQMLQSLEQNKTWIWVPIDIPKFEQEESHKFIQDLIELRLFEKILIVKNQQRVFGAQQRSNIIDRLIIITQDENIEFYQELKSSSPSDNEIISSLIMNIINYSIEYEKMMINWKDPTTKQSQGKYIKGDEIKLRIQRFQDLFTPTQIWCVRSDHMSFPIPKQLKYEELIERPQLSQAYWIQQKFQSQHEPAFQFYSDILYTKINDKQQEILFTHIGEKQLYGSLGFYFLHLLCLPKAHMQKLLSYEYRQKLLIEIFEGALEIQYKTKL